MKATRSIAAQAVGPEGARDIARALPEEVPVAVTVNGTSQAVMMCSPADLEDFALGFAYTEGFATPEQIDRLEIVELDAGIEARLWVDDAVADALGARRRAMMGPVGCGLCGIDSLEQALRDLPVLTGEGRIGAAEAAQGPDMLRDHQPLHDRTQAVHAAGFLVPGQGIIAAREDVGRHNALDKLIGALLRDGVDPKRGAVVLTSRVSLEMVQKTVLLGCPILIAVSAPTAHAVRVADAANLTIAAFARSGRLETFTHPQRIDRSQSDAA
ncbi:formate dehydrogenase accessory sulfurtransferase FdhD [Jannaschia sp. CCS1]|uniref:formate dehydrogenase accessory sulfurtransferase FdhD n=1 Tax=Jannaschia sp. (strain CCS1) TaxID=290400 RepID=UPI000053A883|nr:formate dehydrogenase accessory sulfurtransferase FdhD [Jannaschia sp. CCS1]ABD55474.1 formate dehydrogenase family accessory protein FdhD [Jannaschia sp. CCS1]